MSIDHVHIISFNPAIIMQILRPGDPRAGAQETKHATEEIPNYQLKAVEHLRRTKTVRRYVNTLHIIGKANFMSCQGSLPIMDISNTNFI
jgi:hypothetical protein